MKWYVFISFMNERNFGGFDLNLLVVFAALMREQSATKAGESLALATALGEALRASGLRPSLHHAEPIAGEARTLLDPERGIYRFDELAVLSEATMAAVLIEAGVIVHRDEELELATPAFRDKLAQAVLVAARAHCARLRERPRR